MTALEEKMDKIYTRTGISLGMGRLLNGEKNVIKFFKSSKDFDELKKAWIRWHDKTGKQMKKIYPQIVKLNNQNAREAGELLIGYNSVESNKLQVVN